MSNPIVRVSDQATDEILGEAGPADLEQQYADPMNHPAVRVAQDGPVMVQTLPADGPAASGRVSLVVADQETARVLNIDQRRSRLTLIAPQAFRVGFSQQEAINGAVWPANLPCPLTTTSEVWVARDTADTVVSWIFESWTR